MSIMNLVQIAEIFFGALFIILALVLSRQIFGGIFYTKKVKAVVGDRKVTRSVRIDGVRYTGSSIYWAQQRDRKRHKQSDNRKKRTYNTHTVEHISFTYEDNGVERKTSPQDTICPVSATFIDSSAVYNIKVSRNKPYKARLGLFEVLRNILMSKTNIILKLILSIAAIINALMLLVADAGIAALGAWIIYRAVK